MASLCGGWIVDMFVRDGDRRGWMGEGRRNILRGE